MKILKVEFNKDVFTKLYSANKHNMTLKDLNNISSQVYVVNDKFNGFTKLSNIIYKKNKDEAFALTGDNLWILKEIIKYNEGLDDGYVTIDMVRNYLPYYQGCLENGCL